MVFIKNILFIFVIAFFFAGLTSGVNMALTKRIQLNEETRTSRQLLEVLGIHFPPGSTPEAIRQIESKRVKSTKIGQDYVYAAFDEKGVIERYAFPISGRGLWGPIHGLVSLNNSLSKVDGLIFTSHSETPGLGARIDEKWFRDQFKGIDVSKGSSQEKFVSFQLGGKESSNRLDAITGATITSNSVQNILNNDLKAILSEKDQIRRIDWPSLPKR